MSRRIYCETPRFLLREITLDDAAGLFKLDSNPEVHRYLGNKPLTSVEEIYPVIHNLRQQYSDNGIARWAVEDKLSGDFVGWAGMKLEKSNHLSPKSSPPLDYYDLGYRIRQEYWSRGIATECALAAIAYARNNMQINELFAAAHLENTASRKVLTKVGFIEGKQFYYENLPCLWYRMQL
jgi:RimJ/RimL family protein N-acetyltransferase